MVWCGDKMDKIKLPKVKTNKKMVTIKLPKWCYVIIMISLLLNSFNLIPTILNNLTKPFVTEARIKMNVAAWMADGNKLKKVWEFDQQTYLKACITMNRFFSGAGPAAVIIVKCGEFSDINSLELSDETKTAMKKLKRLGE